MKYEHFLFFLEATESAPIEPGTSCF